MPHPRHEFSRVVNSVGDRVMKHALTNRVVGMGVMRTGEKMHQIRGKIHDLVRNLKEKKSLHGQIMTGHSKKMGGEGAIVHGSGEVVHGMRPEFAHAGYGLGGGSYKGHKKYEHHTPGLVPAHQLGHHVGHVGSPQLHEYRHELAEERPRNSKGQFIPSFEKTKKKSKKGGAIFF